MRGLPSVFVGAWMVLAGIVACGGDDADDGASTEGTGDGSSSGTSPTTTMQSSATTLTGADDDSSGAPESTGGSEDTTGTDESTTDTTSDTGAGGCAGLDQAACQGDDACNAVVGAPYMMQGDTWCVGMREFVECQDAGVCDQVITSACDGDEPWRFADSCIPTGWSECPPPADGQINAC